MTHWAEKSWLKLPEAARALRVGSRTVLRWALRLKNSRGKWRKQQGSHVWIRGATVRTLYMQRVIGARAPSWRNRSSTTGTDTSP